MRNLKRALSLTLASVMLLGMMVVGSSAAAGYDDVKETDNVEAIEVLQAVEVMVGDDRGFGPDRPVNRAEMAVVMGKLLNLDYNYYVSTCPFTDVSGNYDWAKGWVGACAANGIVSGRGNGVYDPGATVTAVEAASMMMRALGYFKYTEDYADGFNVVTVRQGSQIGIFNGVGTDANTPMTRNQVAQMALNALESEMVTFTGTPGINANGVSVGYRAEYTPRTSTQTKYQAIEKRTSDVSGGNNLNRGQYYIQLGEELYNGKLTKRYARDDFERPSINWQYDGKDIGTYVDYDLLVAGGTYKTGVKFAELYDLLTYTTINENDVLRYEDGVNLTVDKKDFNRSNKTEVGGTGALTEVFLDLERDEIIITTINTYLAKANSDYNSTNESLSLKVFAENEKGITKIVDSREVPEAEDVAKDEYKLVYMSGKDSAASFEGYVRYDVVNIFDIEIMDGAEITKWSKDAPKVVGKLTTGGTEYSSNRKAYYDYGNVLDDYDLQLLSDMSYNIYMDRYGNVIGVDLHEGAKNYVFITGYDRGRSNISVKTAEAAAIFTDGTMDTITVNVSDTNKNIRSAVNSTKEPGAYGEYDEWVLTGNNLPTGGDRNLNRWYTYTQSANGNYTLKPVKNFIFTAYKDTAFDSNGVKILDCANLFLDDSSKLTSKGRVYGEDASIYLAVDTGEVDYSGANTPGGISSVNDAITDVEGVYTGAQDIKIELTNDVKDGGSKGKVNNDKTKDNPPVAQESLAEQDAYVYTIFDNDNYIIASVVMGDAQGAAANYVYVLDGAKNERVERASSSRDANTDTYYWEFDAVVDGEKQTLTVKEKYSTTLAETLNVHGIVEIRYDGEYVVDIKNVDDSDIFYYWTENGRLVQSREIEDNEVYDVGNQWNGAYGSWAKSSTDWRGVGNVHNTRLMDKNTNASNRYAYNYDKIDRVEGTIYLQGRTLYVDNKYTNSRDIGLGLVRDAKAVLVQPENGKIEVTSCATVQEAIDRLSDRVPETTEPGIQFKGRIAGVLDGRGVAEWVVIISDTNLVTGNTPDYGIDSILEWNYELHEWILNIPSTELEEWEKNGTAVVYSWLVKAGCSNVEKTTKGWDFTFKGVYNKDQIVNINWVYDDEVIRSVNPVLPTETTLEDGATLPTAKAETGAHYTVSISWTKDGKAYNDTKVNGAGTYAWTVTLTADKGYTFASGLKTSFNGTITVEAKEELGNPVTDITFTITEPDNGSASARKWGMYDTKGNVVTEPKQGQKIVFKFPNALKFTEGATQTGTITLPNGNKAPVWTVDKTATKLAVTENDGWVWFLTGWADASNVFDDNLADEYPAARMARAAAPANWMKALKEGKGPYYAILSDEIAVKFFLNADKKVQFAPYPETLPLNKVLAAVREADENDTEIKMEDTAPDTTPESDEYVKAIVDTIALDVTFEKWSKTAVTLQELTAEEMAGALKAELKKDFTISADKKTATSDDGIKYTIHATPARVWKISYPGGAVYAKNAADTKNVADVKAGVTGLVRSDVTVGNTVTGPTAFAVNDKHEANALKLDGYKDTTYVEAVEIMDIDAGNIQEGGANKLLATVAKDDNPAVTQALAISGTANYIQVGKTIHLARATGFTLASDEKLELSVNGSVVHTFTPDATGEFAAYDLVVPNAVDATAKELTITVKTVKASDKAGVYVDDAATPLTPFTKADGKTYVNIPLNGKSLVSKNKTTGALSPIAGGTLGSNGVLEVEVNTLKAVADTLSADGTKINVYTAWKVTTPTTTPWVGYTGHALGGSATVKLGDAATTYVVDGGILYVEASDPNVILGERGTDGKIHELAGTRLVHPSADTAVTAQGLWAYPVTKEITGTEFVAAVTFAAPSNISITKSVKAGTATDAIAITGITLVGDTVLNYGSQVFTGEKAPLKGVNLTGAFEVNSTKNGLNVKLTPNADVRMLGATVTDAGKLSITINGIGFDVKVDTSAGTVLEAWEDIEAKAREAVKKEYTVAEVTAAGGNVGSMVSDIINAAAFSGNYAQYKEGYGALIIRQERVDGTAGDPNGQPGLYTVTVKLTSAETPPVKTSFDIEFSVKAQTYAELGKAAIATAKNDISTLLGKGIASGDAGDLDAAKVTITNAVNNNKGSTVVESVVCSEFVAAGSGNGSVKVTITLSCNGVQDTFVVNTTINK